MFQGGWRAGFAGIGFEAIGEVNGAVGGEEMVRLGDVVIGEVGENGIEPIGFGVVEECPGADEVDALFEQETFYFGVLADVADGPVGQGADFGIIGGEDLEANGVVGRGV